jgi:hypothetical protein
VKDRFVTITITWKSVLKVVAVFLAGALALTACEHSSSGAQSKGQAQTEQAFGRQSAAVPYPADKLNDSLERRNLLEKLLRYNNPSKISYIYLLSDTGAIISFFTIKGKVSSNSSQMTTDQLVTYTCSGGGNCDHSVVDAPGDDGSYGLDEPGIFFFTSDGVMVTWSGAYLLADAPLKISDPHTVVTYVDGSKPTSTGK